MSGVVAVVIITVAVRTNIIITMVVMAGVVVRRVRQPRREIGEVGGQP